MEVYLFMTELSKEKQWRKHIDDCTSSGLSIEAWCTANEVSSYQYHYWKKKFNKPNHQIKNETQWAPLIIETRQVPHQQESPITLHVGTYKIDVVSGFDKQTLSGLVQLLGALC